MNVIVESFPMDTESQQPPQFTTEIVDARVQEGEEAKFECYFAGNPKPGITENRKGEK